MTKVMRQAEHLKVQDVKKYPVWRFINDDSLGETFVTPEINLPLENLDSALIGDKLKLANGQFVWGILGNISSEDPRSTQHFITLSIEKGGNWFSLARYHDVDFLERSPKALSDFLGLSLAQVFPISYDASRFSKGDISALRGLIYEEPVERLSRTELMQLIFGGT